VVCVWYGLVRVGLFTVGWSKHKQSLVMLHCTNKYIIRKTQIFVPQKQRQEKTRKNKFNSAHLTSCCREMEEAAPPHDEGQAPYGVSDEKEILSQAEARRVEATSVVDAKLEENHANEPIDDVAEKEQEERNAENEKEAAKTSIEKERREGREGEKEEIKEKEKEKEKDVGRSGASKPSPAAGQPRRRGGIQNYKFYMNEIVSQPSGNYIDQVHLLWFYNYEKLEEHHGYVLLPPPTHAHANDGYPSAHMLISPRVGTSSGYSLSLRARG